MTSNKQKSVTSAKRGGAREGAGRPKGTGRYKEATKAIRVPIGSLPVISRYLDDYKADKASAQVDGPQSNVVRFLEPQKNVSSGSQAKAPLKIPLFSSKVAAGVPSNAEDHIEDTLDLNQYLIDRPESTYMLKVEGDSMIEAGIHPNDILVVDRSLTARHKQIVIASIDGQLTVKRLIQKEGLIQLKPENKEYPTLNFDDSNELQIWGVVVGSLRKFQAL